MRYIAFLRAINVGGHVVKMEQLRALFAEMGVANVETFIASGNVIFESRSKSESVLQKKIEGHLHQGLGYEVTTFLRTDEELAKIAARQAFPATATNENAVVYVAFLATKPNDAAVATLVGHQSEVDEFKVHGREVYWLCRKNFSDSAFSGSRLEKVLGMRATVRNSTTVKKLAAKLCLGSW